MKEWTGKNSLIVLYFVFAVLLEMIAVFVVEGSPFLTRPFLSLGLLLLLCGILLFIKSNRARTIVCGLLLLVQMLLDMVFDVIFSLTDQYFDFSMLTLKNDAFAILENLPVNFIIFYVGLAFALTIFVYGFRRTYKEKRVSAPKKSAFFYVGMSLAGIATVCTSFLTYFPREEKNKYDEMLVGRASTAYSAYGMIGNLLGEAGKTLFQKTTPIAGADIDEFIYAKTSNGSPYFGTSKGKNVVVVLGESFEWYTFLRGDSDYAGSLQGEYVNALEIPQEVLKELYPNLTRFYEESVVMTNFHAREKTDIAETLAIMGTYPTGPYVNYEYEENTLPFTLPNLLKQETDGNIHVRSFHNGFKSFYNREVAHATFGFDKVNGLLSPVDMNDMEEMSNKIEANGGKEIFYDYMDEGERNLDSEMVATAKDLMFPTDRRFCTYITTITMHGMYYDRVNMRKENNTKLAEKLTLLERYKPTEETTENFVEAERLYYYMTTGLEFDLMLGLMMEDLESKNLLDDTLIAVYGDHNAYYQGMSGFVKDIPDYDTENKFTDLYNIPFMLWDKDLVAAVPENERMVNKFTCTADIMPTLMDLLGITYFENLYYGRSVFAKEESVLYSRAYDVFVGDGILRRSVKGDYYLYDGLNENGVPVADTLAAFEAEGERLVEKIKYCDYIFRQDHFGETKNYTRFVEEMDKINT